MKTSFEEYRTKKFVCKRCKNNDMLPNKEGEFIKGFRCRICNEINYPTTQSENKDIIINIKEVQNLDKNELLEYVENLIIRDRN
jgi:hypothetical protein